MALNVVWSVVFFGAQELFYRFLNIVALWAAILVTIALSFRVSRNSAALLVSYLFWVTIASALNYYVWVLNA